MTLTGKLTGKFLSLFRLKPEEREAIHREISFFEAVEAHVAWKRRLNDYLLGNSQEKLEPHQVSVDNRCTLGKWIHGPAAARFGEFPLFLELVDQHARFHLVAAKVLEAYQNGDEALAIRLLYGDFARQSKETVDCILKLHAFVEGEDKT